MPWHARCICDACCVYALTTQIELQATRGCIPYSTYVGSNNGFLNYSVVVSDCVCVLCPMLAFSPWAIHEAIIRSILTLVRASIDRAIASMKGKNDDFAVECDKVIELATSSNVTNCKDMINDIKKKRDFAMVDYEEHSKALINVRETLDTEEDVTAEILKLGKTETAEKSAQFVAENSRFKIAKFATEKYKKTCNSYVKKVAKEKLTAASVNASGGDKSESVVGLEALKAFPDAVDSGNGVDLMIPAVHTSPDVHNVTS